MKDRSGVERGGGETNPFYLSDEDRQRSFDEEDQRWSAAAQWKDWLFLLGMMLAMIAWGLFVYFLEPGLR